MQVSLNSRYGTGTNNRFIPQQSKNVTKKVKTVFIIMSHIAIEQHPP